MLPDRAIHDEDHRHPRASTRRFIQAETAPHFDRWETAGIVDRCFWDRAGAAGLFCPTVPEDFGGIGGDFRMNAVVAEDLAWSGFAGPAADVSVHSDVCLGYLLSHATPEQKARWLPGMVDGSAVCAIAMTEPGTGSDLQGIRTTAVRDGDDWVINGQKTLISNGQHADPAIVVTRTAEGRGSGNMSRVVVEATRPGFRPDPNPDKLGQISANTSGLFLDTGRVPADNLLGIEGKARPC